MSQTFSLQKSKKLLEENGFETWIVEKPYNPYTKRRQDLFNFIDLVGIRNDFNGVTGVQACGEDCSSHIRKILEGFTSPSGEVIGPNKYLPVWLHAGNRFFIWSWVIRGARGKRKTYKLREIEFRIKDGQVVAEETPVSFEKQENPE